VEALTVAPAVLTVALTVVLVAQLVHKKFGTRMGIC